MIWRIESMADAPRWRYIDQLRLADVPLGDIHRFSILWGGSDEDGPYTTFSERQSVHDIELSAYYPVGVAAGKTIDIQYQIAQDRHNLIALLRDPSLWVGYADTASSADIGIIERARVSDELDTGDDNIWVLRMAWQMIIREQE